MAPGDSAPVDSAPTDSAPTDSNPGSGVAAFSLEVVPGTCGSLYNVELVGSHDAMRAAVCAAAAARAVPVLLSVSLRYARPAPGLGRALGGTGWARAAVAVVIAIVLCVLLHAALLFAVVAGIALACGIAAHRWLGGVTGDVLGAAAELSETGALIAAVALL